MADLYECLAEAESVFRRMQELATEGSEDGKREVVRLRSRYAMLMLDIRQARKSDTGLQGRPGLALEFDQRLARVGRALAEHQSKWRIDAIQSDPSGYMASAASLNDVQDQFYRWVREDLSPT